jgi:hypothetical protein
MGSRKMMALSVNLYEKSIWAVKIKKAKENRLCKEKSKIFVHPSSYTRGRAVPRKDRGDLGCLGAVGTSGPSGTSGAFGATGASQSHMGA